jgi:4-hydroxybenzoyl-CoA thioesterase
MSKTHIHRVDVHFGDCDPAGIVFFPNFSRWMDQASLAFFMACGVPPWRELEATRGIVGTPLLEIHTRFLRPATYGQTLEVHTHVEEWREKVLIQHHRILRGDELLCEGRETRAFVVRLPGSYKMKSIPIPEDIKAMCQ